MYGKAKLGNINELIKGASKSSVTDHPVRIEPSEEFHGQTEKNGKFIGLRQGHAPTFGEKTYPENCSE